MRLSTRPPSARLTRWPAKRRAGGLCLVAKAGDPCRRVVNHIIGDVATWGVKKTAGNHEIDFASEP